MRKKPLHVWFPQKGPAMELWEMPYQHVQHTIKFIEAFVKALPKKAARPWKLRIKLLERELKYREDNDYRNMQIALRKSPNDGTLMLVLADRCQELDYWVMDRRLRRKVAHERSDHRLQEV